MPQSLTAPEVRALGALIEKDLSTPEYYPMTVSALVAACNQKTNRDPVVSYVEMEVEAALEGLQRKRLAGSSTSAHGRATRYRHALVEALGLDRPQLAILAELLLRGPSTPGELRGRAARMTPISTLEEVDETLRSLMERDEPLVTRLERRPGQKEARYAHLLAGEPVETDAPTSNGVDAGLAERVGALERQVAELQAAFVEFRKQFE